MNAPPAAPFASAQPLHTSVQSHLIGAQPAVPIPAVEPSHPFVHVPSVNSQMAALSASPLLYNPGYVAPVHALSQPAVPFPAVQHPHTHPHTSAHVPSMNAQPAAPVSAIQPPQASVHLPPNANTTPTAAVTTSVQTHSHRSQRAQVSQNPQGLSVSLPLRLGMSPSDFQYSRIPTVKSTSRHSAGSRPVTSTHGITLGV